MTDSATPEWTRQIAATPLSDALVAERDRLESAGNDDEARRALDPWGLGELTGGFPSGRLYALVGHSGVGKTTAVLDLVRHASVKGFPTVLFSLEADRAEVARRLWAGQARTHVDELRAGRFPEASADEMHEAFQKLRDAPLQIADHPRPSADEIVAAARAIAATASPRLVVVDGLDFLAAPEGKFDREPFLGRVAHDLRALAVELRCAVLATVSLRRATAKQARRAPRFRDLRSVGAGELELHCDVVLGLQRAPADPHRSYDATLHLMKNRLGPPGSVPLLMLDRPRLVRRAVDPD